MDCDNLLNVTMLLDQEMSKTGYFQDFDIGVLQKRKGERTKPSSCVTQPYLIAQSGAQILGMGVPDPLKMFRRGQSMF